MVRSFQAIIRLTFPLLELLPVVPVSTHFVYTHFVYTHSDLVMGLYMLHVHCVRHSRYLVDLADVSPHIRVVDDAPLVTL